MNENDFRAMARDLMSKNGLNKTALHVKPSGTHGTPDLNTIGFTAYGNGPKSALKAQSLNFSKEWVDAMDEDDAKNVIMHEIAHALTPRDAPGLTPDGHGKPFEETCKRLGIPEMGASCYHPKNEPPMPFYFQCEKCGLKGNAPFVPFDGFDSGLHDNESDCGGRIDYFDAKTNKKVKRPTPTPDDILSMLLGF